MWALSAEHVKYVQLSSINRIKNKNLKKTMKYYICILYIIYISHLSPHRSVTVRIPDLFCLIIISLSLLTKLHDHVNPRKEAQGRMEIEL
jgi:hypothetical protein